jgi:hypothetical protein
VKASSIHVGAIVDRTGVKEMGALILSILDTPAGDDVKKAALEAVAKAIAVNNTSITGCNFR